MNALSVSLDLVCRLGGDWVAAAIIARVQVEAHRQGVDWVVLTQADWDALCIPRNVRQRRLAILQANGELLVRKVKAQGGGVRISYSVPSGVRDAQPSLPTPKPAPPQPPLPEPEELQLRPPEPKPTKRPPPKPKGDFEAFWDAYAKKVDRRRAEKAYAAALKVADPTTIHAAAAAWGAAHQNDRTYQPHPTTWLNGHRWNDPPPTPKPGAQRREAGKPSTDGDLEKRASRYYAAASLQAGRAGPTDAEPNG